MQFLAALTDEQVAYIIMAVIGVIFLVGAIVIFVREWQKKKNIKVKNGVRYTVSTKSEDKQEYRPLVSICDSPWYIYGFVCRRYSKKL